MGPTFIPRISHRAARTEGRDELRDLPPVLLTGAMQRETDGVLVLKHQEERQRPHQRPHPPPASDIRTWSAQDHRRSETESEIGSIYSV